MDVQYTRIDSINQLPQPLFSVDTVCLEDFTFINQSQNGTGDIVEWHWGQEMAIIMYLHPLRQGLTVLV